MVINIRLQSVYWFVSVIIGQYLANKEIGKA